MAEKQRKFRPVEVNAGIEDPSPDERAILDELLATVRERHTSLERIFEIWIADAIRRGLIVNAEGIAMATNPLGMPKDPPMELPESPMTSARAAEFRRELDANHADFMRRLEAHSARLFSDPEALRTSVANNCEVEALNLVLRDGRAQSRALQQLGHDLVEQPVLLELAARILAPSISSTAYGWGVSAESLTAAAPALEQMIETHERMHAWEAGLENVFRTHHHWWKADNARGSVLDALDILAMNIADLPANLREPTAERIDDACRVLHSLADYTIMWGGKAGGKGKRITAWGAAQRFAEAFRVQMSARKSDRQRDYSKVVRRDPEVSGRAQRAVKPAPRASKSRHGSRSKGGAR